jgi:hypothetical protein
MPVKVTMRPNWDGNIEQNLKDGVLEMATDIHRRAIVIAPKDSRALVNSGVIEPVTNGYKIKFGSSRVPYARKRHFENKKNPQTLGYLAKAGDSVARGNTAKYFSKKII